MVTCAILRIDNAGLESIIQTFENILFDYRAIDVALYAL